MELNSINKKGRWEQIAQDLNENFENIGVAVEQVKNTTSRNKGYFVSLDALNAQVTRPTVGDKAYVGSGSSYTVYQYTSSGWTNTGTASGNEVPNLDNYYTEDEADQIFLGYTREAEEIEDIAPTLVTEALRKTAQTLTENEKTIARGNIGAASAADVTNLTTKVDTNKTETDTKITELASEIGKLEGFVTTEPKKWVSILDNLTIKSGDNFSISVSSDFEWNRLIVSINGDVNKRIIDHNEVINQYDVYITANEEINKMSIYFNTEYSYIEAQWCVLIDNSVIGRIDKLEKSSNESIENIESLNKNTIILNREVESSKIKIGLSLNYIFHKGYLDKITVGFVNEDEYVSKTTTPLNVKEGDVFAYKGVGRKNAMSCLLRNGEYVINSLVIDSPLSYTDVIIPSGVDNVIFSSFAEVGSEVILDVKLAKNIIESIDSIEAATIENMNNLGKIIYSGGITPSTWVQIANKLTLKKGDVFRLKVNTDIQITRIIVGVGSSPSSNRIYDEFVETNSIELTHQCVDDIDSMAIYLVGDADIKTTAELCFGICYDVYHLNGLTKNFLATEYLLGYPKLLNINEQSYWHQGGINSTTGVPDTRVYRLYSDFFNIAKSGSISWELNNDTLNFQSVPLYIYDQNKNFIGYKTIPINGLNIAEILSDYPLFHWCRIGVIAPADETLLPSIIGVDLSFREIEIIPFEEKSITEQVAKNTKDLKEKSNTTGSVLYGKKYVACGDSFTLGSFASITDENGLTGQNSPQLWDDEYKCWKSYAYWVAKRNGMDYINDGIGGSTMAYIETHSGKGNAFSLDRYKNIPMDADYITLKFGINDGHQDVVLGTIDDIDNTTFYGAWNVVLKYLVENFPFAKIGVIISNGLDYNELADATIECCKKWGIPYLDEVYDEKVPLLHRVDRPNVDSFVKTAKMEAFRISESDAHPNPKAHLYESTFVEEWLKSL